MRLQLYTSIFIFILICTGVYAEQIEKYGVYEFELSTSEIYDNPYVDISVSAVFTSPSNATIEVEGFWNGENVWNIRFMPEETGLYQYITVSNDTEMHGHSGEFICIQSDRPGIIGLDPENPYAFAYSNGDPFLWMGETAWYLMSIEFSFTDGTFQQYIRKRREQNFNNIHCVLGTGGLPYKTYNPENEGGHIWESQSEQRINPGFFTWMDKRIAYMDSQQMGLGLFFTWSQHFTTFSREEYERLERYLIARYAAYPLIYWVIVGEFDETGEIDDYIYHGNVVNTRDPYNHLISIQPGHADRKNRGSNRIFADQEWLDFIMLQLPYHFSGASYTAYDCNEYVLTDRQYDKPVVDIEFGYEDYKYPKTVVSSDDIRKFAWGIYFGGGFGNYGHGDVIRTYDAGATDSSGAIYMSNLYSFFDEIDWRNMSPNNNAVNTGFCMKSQHAEYVIYMPDSGDVRVDMNGVSGELQSLWYNPVNASYQSGGAFTADDSASFISPFPDDAVLYLSPLERPIISISTDTLHFAGVELADEQFQQSIIVMNTGEGELYWQAAEAPDAGWLSIDKTNGNSGDEIIVLVQTAGLTPGIYSANIQISDSNAVNNPVTVPVVLNVKTLDPLQRPVISINSDTLHFAGVESADEQLQQSFIIMNTGEGVLYWQAAEAPDVDWLSLDKSSGSSGDTIRVNVQTAGLAPGVYTSNIQISDSNAVNNPVIVPVVLNIISLNPLLSVSANFIDFADNLEQQILILANQGGDTLLWNVAYDTTIKWIAGIAPLQGQLTASASQNVAISIDRKGIPPGYHDALIAVHSNAGSREILVGMIVLKPAKLSVDTDILKFDSTISSLSFQIRNDGDSTLQWSAGIDADSSWLIKILPENAELEGGSQMTANVFAYRAGMEAGRYSDSIVVNSNGGQQIIKASMDVGKRYFFVHRINCGSEMNYTDNAGNVWGIDKSLLSGYWGFFGGGAYQVSDAIENTEDDELYQSERWGSDGYSFDVENGIYDLSLHFAEIYFESPEMRVFDVIVEGDTIFSDFDIFAEAGHDSAMIKHLQIVVIDSQLNIEFNPIIEDPKISAIEIVGEQWISNVDTQLAHDFPARSRLDQNFPNPFNPATTLAFSLQENGYVNLCIYNIMGQKITTLVDSPLQKGEHKIVWRAGQELPSGLYFMRIEIVGTNHTISETRKMLLAK